MTTNTSLGAPRSRVQSKTDEYTTDAHAYIATHDRETLLLTIPTGEDVAKQYLDAAIELDCEPDVRKHFARVYNEQTE